ncbi:sulfur carrier protein ThiS [Lachnospiraceae bacterium 62-35]
MIFVNGKSAEYQKDMTLKEFLLEQGFVIERIAVECNGEIVPKAIYDKKILKEEDRLEVVNFVGGG